MKPSRLLFYAIAIAFVVWCAIVLALGPDADPATSAETATDPPQTTTVEVERTLQGHTVGEWHRIAGRYLQSVRALNHKPAPWGGSWLERAFLCIHSHEGSWTDPNAPYFGGVQMDLGFQRTYAPWALRAFGTADHWPVSVQLAAAIQAWTSRGFYPWPNTARYCGLIR